LIGMADGSDHPKHEGDVREEPMGMERCKQEERNVGWQCMVIVSINHVNYLAWSELKQDHYHAQESP